MIRVRTLPLALMAILPATASSHLLTDLKTAWRGVRRRPVHTGLAVGILALGLSAGVGVFAYVNGFRQPFPGADARGLVQLHDRTAQDPFGDLSYLDYVDYARTGDAAFQGMAAVRAGYAASIRHETSTEVVFLEAVSGSYFDVLDVEMALGRRIQPSPRSPAAPASPSISATSTVSAVTCPCSSISSRSAPASCRTSTVPAVFPR